MGNLEALSLAGALESEIWGSTNTMNPSVTRLLEIFLVFQQDICRASSRKHVLFTETFQGFFATTHGDIDTPDGPWANGRVFFSKFFFSERNPNFGGKKIARSDITQRGDYVDLDGFPR